MIPKISSQSVIGVSQNQLFSYPSLYVVNHITKRLDGISLIFEFTITSWLQAGLIENSIRVLSHAYQEGV